MRTQIQRSLFFMGLIAVVITFVMSAVMYYQGMQGQHIRELQMTTYTASQALHREDKQEGISYLEGIYKENPAGIHIVWLDKTGEVLYDSEGDNGEPYAEQPEVQQGFKEGESFSISRYKLYSSIQFFSFANSFAFLLKRTSRGSETVYTACPCP